MGSERGALTSLVGLLALTVLLALFVPQQSFATDYYWTAGSGDWSDPSNWNPGVPQENGSWENRDTIYLIQSDAIDRTLSVSTSAHDTTSRVIVDATGAGAITLSVPEGGGLAINNLDIGLNGTGIVNQTGGGLVAGVALGPGSIVLGVNPGSSGTYNLSGGNVVTQNFIVGRQGTGVFNQNGGNVRVEDARLQVGPLGTYNLSGTGILRMTMEALGGERIEGTFNQSGGVNDLWGPQVTVSGGTYNLSGGELTSPGFASGGIGMAGGTSIENNGTFNQSGGDFGMGYLRVGATTSDASRFNLSNGTLQAYEIRNNGTFNYSGGELDIVPVPNYSGFVNALTNNGSFNLSGSGTRTIDGDVVNNGTFKTTHTTAVYTGTFTNNGAYISDPAAQLFNDLIIGQTGYLKGQLADFFFVGGDFLNYSIMNTDWNTALSYLGFVDGADALHDFYLAGFDYGAVLSGYSDNFSWGLLDVRDQLLHLYDGNDIEGGAVYVGDILGLEIAGHLITNITGMDDLNIYYLANLPGNWYLQGLEYELEGGGHLIPVGRCGVPEPATFLLVGTALAGLAGFGRKFGK